jgi:hypothetical protein
LSVTASALPVELALTILLLPHFFPAMLSLSSWRDARLSSSLIFRALAERDADAILSTKWRGLAMAEEGVAKACEAAIIDAFRAPLSSDEILDALTFAEALEAAEVDAAADAGVLLAALQGLVPPIEITATNSEGDDELSSNTNPTAALDTITNDTTNTNIIITAETDDDTNCPLEWPLAMLWLEKRALSDGRILRKFVAETKVATLGGAGTRAAIALSLRHQLALVALARHELSIENFGDYKIHIAALGSGFFTCDDRIVAPMIHIET